MPSRFLIVRFSAIGDCVLATWAATALRLQHPDAEIVWAAESRCAPVIDTDRLATSIYEIERRRWKRRPGPSSLAAELRAYLGIRKYEFDWGFDLQGHSKTALLLRIAKTKRRVAARATDPFAARLNPVLLGFEQAGHTVVRNLRVLSESGALELPSRPIMPPVTTPEALKDSTRLATIMTGAGHPSKLVPVEHWISVARGLLKEGWQVAFVGGPDDPRILLSNTLDLVGKLSLRETMGAIQASKLHLAGDTGTGHLAAAYGIPLISIFGPTDPAVFRPYAETTHVLQHGSSPADTSPHVILETIREIHA